MFKAQEPNKSRVLGEGHKWASWWPYSSTLLWLTWDMKGYLVEINKIEGLVTFKGY